MKYRIVMDSAGELPPELEGRAEFAIVPFTLIVNGNEITDDGHMSQRELVREIALDPDCPRTACPSPEAFVRELDPEAEHNFLLTISAELSGSYQSAYIAMNMFLEDHPDAKIHVFNSTSTSVGELLVLLKIVELEEAGVPFDELIPEVEAFGRSKNTLFVLDNLETLRKNGRLGGLKAAAAAVLKIKPICYGTVEGAIGQLDQARGMGKALVKLAGHVVERTKDPEKRILGISYCNCRDRAEIVRDELVKRMKVKDVILLPTGGLSSVYANDGGIIVSI